MDTNPGSRMNDEVRRPGRGGLAGLLRRGAPGKTLKMASGGSLAHRLMHVAVVMGMIAVLVGAGHLAAWLGGYLSQRGLSTITMKTNAALCLTLVGVALILLVAPEAGSMRRWIARACAALALLLGFLTLVENVSGWNFGIDQLLAVETPGAIDVVSPNRMGTPGSLGFALLGLALLLLSRRNRRGVRTAQTLALAVCLVGLLPTIGFFYGAQEFYGIARYTAISWPTAVVFSLLGVGLLCVRPAEGLMAQVTANDPGGVSIRRLLPALVILPLLLGWLRLVGERSGVFDPAMGTGMMMLLFVIIFSALAFHAGREAGRSAETLRQSEDRFRTMANAIPQLAWIAQADGYIYWYNQRWYDYTGTTPAQMEGWGWQSVHDRQELPTVLERWKSSIATGQPFDMIFPLRGADGVFRPFLTRVMPLRDEQGRVQQWFGTNTDVSEQQRAEEALRESEAGLAAAQRLAHIGSWQWNIAADTARWSEETFRIFALARGPLQQHRVDFISRIVPEDRRRVDQALSDALSGTRDYDLDYRIRLPDGRERVIHAQAQVLRDSNGRPVMMHGTVQDITERKRAEEMLQELNATLESKVAQRTAELEYRARQLQKLTLELTQAEERERRRIAVILHEDLQQQIAGARFHLNLVRNRAGDDRQRAEVDGVNEMLREAIETSRSLAYDLSPAVVHMTDLAEVLQWLVNRVRAQHGLNVEVAVAGGMTVHSEALAMFLFRAAQEMLFNVVKHAHVRQAAIRVRRIGRCVCLSVVDHGRGFDPQELQETSGVGLFSIRERTELLGGRLRVKSAKGQGSRFRLLVPDGPKAQGREKATEDMADLYGVSAVVPLPSSGGALRVLLVDDHDIVRQGLAALLQEAPGIVVVGEAANGREAINLTSVLHPDVVIMDVSMPLLSGDQATRQIKMHMPETRVIALSMYDEADKKERMYQAGAESYLLKTASAEELFAAIRGQESDVRKDSA